MSLEEIIEYCLSYPNTYKDYPFGEEWTTIRHSNNKKLFALIYYREGNLCANLKCDPERADFLRSIHKDVKPGYHMNKEHWNTVILDGELEADDIQAMVRHSYELTQPKVSKKRV